MKPLSLLLFLVALAVAESEVAHVWERIYLFSLYQIEGRLYPDQQGRQIAVGCVGKNGRCTFLEVRVPGPPCLSRQPHDGPRPLTWPTHNLIT